MRILYGMRWVLGVFAVLVLAACSPTPPATGAPTDTPIAAPTSQASMGPTSSDSAKTSLLVLRQAATPPVGPLFIEGAVAFAEVVDDAGMLAASGRIDDYLGEADLLRVELPPGAYQVRSYVRSCDGNCGFLDPPTDGCELAVTLEPARRCGSSSSAASVRRAT